MHCRFWLVRAKWVRWENGAGEGEGVGVEASWLRSCTLWGLCILPPPATMTEPRVYTHYTTAPAAPGGEWVRFVLLSDTHSQTTAVPDGDVLLHAGDLTTLGEPADLERQIAWLE